MDNDLVILDVPEVAKAFKMSIWTVRNLARTGDIPAFKVGHQWRFSRSVLKKYTMSKAQKNARKVTE